MQSAVECRFMFSSSFSSNDTDNTLLPGKPTDHKIQEINQPSQPFKWQTEIKQKHQPAEKQFLLSQTINTFLLRLLILMVLKMNKQKELSQTTERMFECKGKTGDSCRSNQLHCPLILIHLKMSIWSCRVSTTP